MQRMSDERLAQMVEESANPGRFAWDECETLELLAALRAERAAYDELLEASKQINLDGDGYISNGTYLRLRAIIEKAAMAQDTSRIPVDL